MQGGGGEAVAFCKEITKGPGLEEPEPASFLGWFFIQ